MNELSPKQLRSIKRARTAAILTRIAAVSVSLNCLMRYVGTPKGFGGAALLLILSICIIGLVDEIQTPLLNRWFFWKYPELRPDIRRGKPTDDGT